MKKLLFTLLLSFVLCPLSQAAQANSLCEANEEIYFNCSVKSPGTLVSLCGSKTLGPKEGYLQYRFGKPGNIELEFPKERENSPGKFAYAHYMRAMVDRTGISFSNNGFTYVLYSDYEGDIKPPVTERGVRILSPQKGAEKETNLVCKGPFVGKAWGVLEKDLPCDPIRSDEMGVGCPEK